MVPEISVVTPVYGSPEAVRELFERVKNTIEAQGATFEIVMVDDRCPHGSWAEVQELCALDQRVVGVRLSRNFGQHAAIYAGLGIARGQWIVVMDCDLQDRPEEISNLYLKAKDGYDLVRARRSQRQDPVMRRLFSWAFYSTLSYLTGVKHSREIANFGIYNRKVVDALLAWREDHRYFPSAVQWIGFAAYDLDVAHSPRRHGRSSYTFRKLFDLGISIVVSFSDKPLSLIAFGGLGLSIVALAVSLIYFVIALTNGFAVPGWATIMVSLWFLFGLLIFALGVTGIYIGQVLRESKGRPNYVIDIVRRHE